MLLSLENSLARPGRAGGLRHPGRPRRRRPRQLRRRRAQRPHHPVGERVPQRRAAGRHDAVRAVHERPHPGAHQPAERREPRELPRRRGPPAGPAGVPRADPAARGQLVAGLRRTGCTRAPASSSPRRPSSATASTRRWPRRRAATSTRAEENAMTTAAVPYQHLGAALATDYFLVRDQFTDEQWRHFLEVAPLRRHRRCCRRSTSTGRRAELPWPLMRRLAELGLLRRGHRGHGCPGMSPLARGLVNMELHRGDGSLGTFLGVQSGLAMKSIDLLGSEEQKERWLPALAQLEKIGAFALTEPEHGSDSVALETQRAARRRRLGARRRQALDRQRVDRRRRRRVGPIGRGRPGQGLPGREGHAGIRAGRRWRARAPRARSGRPTSGSTASASPRLRGCRARARSRTPAACSSTTRRRAPGLRSATPSPRTTSR